MKKRFLIFFAFISLARGAFGNGMLSEESYLYLFYPKSEIVSGATKSVEDIKTAPATFRVFTREEIDDLGAKTLSDLLNTLTSAVVTTQTNSRESLWFRGIRNRYNDKVLILVDSVPISDPVYSHSPIDEYLTLENVERVEVILGPASALYGSNAFAGIINIITKKPMDDSLFNFSFKGGDYNTKGLFMEYNRKSGDFGIYSYFSYFETDGDGLDRQRHYLPQTLKWNPKERIAGGFTILYKDWFFRINRIHYYHTFFTDWDIPTWRWKDEGYFYNDTFSSIEKKFIFSTKTSLNLHAFYADYDLRNYWREFDYIYNEPADPNKVISYPTQSINVFKDGTKSGIDLQIEYSPSPKAKTITGFTFEKIKVGRVEDLWTDLKTNVTVRPFFINPESLNNYAFYIQESLKLSDIVLFLGGIRVDKLDLYGYKTTPRLNFIFTPNSRSVIKFLYGEAFRQPSMREYFTVDLTGYFPSGNTSLKPEKIKSFELNGTYFSDKSGDFSLALFSEKTYDEIYSENNLPYQNFQGNRIRGLEANYHYFIKDKVDLRLAYSRNWCNLYNVPPYLFSCGSVIYFKDKFKLSLFGNYVSKKPRDPKDNFYYDPTRPPYKRGPTAGYLLLNTTFTIYPIFKNIELKASIFNLLNKDYFFPTYEPTKYYDLKAPNRTFLFTLKVKF